MVAYRLIIAAALFGFAGFFAQAAMAENSQSRDRGADNGDTHARRPAPALRRARTRIEVHPGQLLYRDCIDGYREVWRPGWGTKVVTPYLHCWWVRG